MSSYAEKQKLWRAARSQAGRQAQQTAAKQGDSGVSPVSASLVTIDRLQPIPDDSVQLIRQEISNLGEVGLNLGSGGIPGGGRIATKSSLQKLANRFAEIKRKREATSWHSVIRNALDLQKGKVPLLLAVEAGNQSMCRELLSAQTAEQLKVSIFWQFLTVNWGFFCTTWLLTFRFYWHSARKVLY